MSSKTTLRHHFSHSIDLEKNHKFAHMLRFLASAEIGTLVQTLLMAMVTGSTPIENN